MHSPLALVRDAALDAPDGSRAAEPLDALEYLVGVNLARLRAERQLSLDALARASGVSRAMLAQIESAAACRPSRCCTRLRAR
jgi:DNA-binding transcriptional regulator YiaG